MDRDKPHLLYLHRAIRRHGGLVTDLKMIDLFINARFPEYRGAAVEILARAVKRGDRQALQAVTEACTLNTTSFFRNPLTFEHMYSTALPRILSAKGKQEPVSLWSAAASDGKEAYSVAMALGDDVARGSLNIRIEGTDISRDMIEKAQAGRYSETEIKREMKLLDVPPAYQAFVRSHMEPASPDAPPGEWRLAPAIRNMVSFRQLNLVQDLGYRRWEHDIVFCRNILYHLDPDRRADVLARVRDVMQPHGVLYISAEEKSMHASLRPFFKPTDKPYCWTPR